jgi:hypothetical protein
MRGDDSPIVRVQSEWSGWRTATVRLSDIQEIHWFQPPGAPRRLVHGYVSCARMVAGGLPHNCPGSDTRHRLLGCVLKDHTLPAVYAELERRADARNIEQRNDRALGPKESIGSGVVHPVISSFARSP